MKKKSRSDAVIFLSCLIFACLSVGYCLYVQSDVIVPKVSVQQQRPDPGQFKHIYRWVGEAETAYGKYDVSVNEVWPSESQMSYQVVRLHLKSDATVSIRGIRYGNNSLWENIQFSNAESLSPDQSARCNEELSFALGKIRAEKYLVKDPAPSKSDDLSRMGQ